ncbi:DNA-binding protein [Streptomyces albireticuli]|uniref:DNA-binding protein n=1 Tax=Streptomyces albireticuli TaxID=1940 RepID=A0A1Z2L1X6_9ACTN|nr:helix-turn-helix transcriptional regulator [Streptomyces albireticuli]ARZ68299.1 DNA-binding protein [Streptomyces albireticuli]
MPPRSTPTARQKRLGSELRKMRVAAGMTTEAAAKLLGVPRTNLPNMESGRSGISAERVRVLADHYGCTDARWVDALAAMASERVKGWWESYRNVLPQLALDLAESEHHATHHRSVEIVHIPGLLQTEDHIRTMFTYADPTRKSAEVEIRVAFRMDRRTVIEREVPIEFDAIVHEAALRIKVGGRKTARAQLRHLLTMAEQTNVTVRVIPFDAEGFAGAGNAMLYLSGAVPQLDTVQIDTAHGSIILDEDAQLRRYRDRLARITRSALGPRESLDLIHRIAEEM